MNKKYTLLISALLGALALTGCDDKKAESVTIEFMHSSVEQERQAVINDLIKKFEQQNPGMHIKPVPIEEDAYNTKVITLARSGALPAVIETSHDYAKVMDKEQLLDRGAVNDVIQGIGAENFYDGVLRIVKTEDGTSATGVPISGWIQGIWYRKQVLENAGFSEPQNWQQLLTVTRAFTQPEQKRYGIGLPTAESVMTEQSFSQFALSNGANVFDANGAITIDTPEMQQALSFYQQLAKTTLPGSNDIMEIKDAFMNGTVPMAVYSTYILPAIYNEGFAEDIGFAVPAEKSQAVYGTITSLTITAGLTDAQREAAKKFVTFMEQSDNATRWVLMSPGAALPLTKLVTSNSDWQNNPVVKAFGPLSMELVQQFANVQVFGSVGEKNFTSMGDITGSAALSEMVNAVTVGNKEVSATLSQTQGRVASLVQKR